MARPAKQAAKHVFASLFGMVFILFGVGLVAVMEIYWARVVIPERNGLGTAVSVPADKPDPQNDSKLVHVTGPLGGSETLVDTNFNAAADGLRLRRRVWMWQWQQDSVQSKSSYGMQDSQGNNTTLLKTTTYNYTSDWFEKVIDSRSFYNAGHDNPTEMKISPYNVSAAKISLGGFILSPELVGQINNFQTIPASDKSLSVLEPSLRARAVVDRGEIYTGNPKQPAIGDLKVRLEYAPATTVSIIARQDGGKLSPYAVTKTATVALLSGGTHTVSEMTQQFNSDNLKWRGMAWGMGLCAMLFGGGIIHLARKTR